MPRFTRASDLEKHLKKALDSLQAQTLITTQNLLGDEQVSPVDTGRFRSSWFSAEGSASPAVAPEGANSPNQDAQQLRVDALKTYHLTNNLPYAEAIAIEGKTNPEKNQKSKPATWFTDFVNGRVPKIQAKAAKIVKGRFDL
jgi:hypothetical protein